MVQLGWAIHVWPHDLFQDDQFCAICLCDRLKRREAALKSLQIAQVTWHQGCHASCNCLRKKLVEQDVLTAFQSADLHPNLELKDLGGTQLCLQRFLKRLCLERAKVCQSLGKGHGELFGATRSSVNAFAIRIYNMFPFWYRPFRV